MLFQVFRMVVLIEDAKVMGLVCYPDIMLGEAAGELVMNEGGCFFFVVFFLRREMCSLDHNT